MLWGAQAHAETHADTHAKAIDIGDAVRATSTQVDSATVVVRRLSDGHDWVSNPGRAATRFSPASTAKIPHLLIALDADIADANTVFPWDRVARSSALWNRDQTLGSAFQTSAVWVFQQITQMAGPDVMAQGLRQFAYGNAEVGGADRMTTYWLDGTLRISALEQVTFLTNLAQRTFPLETGTYETAFAIMESDAGPGWTLRSKTGWRYSAQDMDIGWFVGWLDCGPETYVFAVNIDMPSTVFLARRKQIAYAALDQVGAFTCP
ncbi:MAG: penicillin-binding transpeptidase domain-containing protein [Pseudomonadota bacterium]